MPALDARQMTRAAYLEWEPRQERRHEFINDRTYAMGGARPRHNAVQGAVRKILSDATSKGPCVEMGSDQGIFVEATDAHLYPDVSVICGDWKLEGVFVTNPTVIIEVLSKSTAEYDRGAKLEHYTQIPSVQHVLFIDPSRHHVLCYRRVGEIWERSVVQEGEVPLQALDTVLPMEAIYERVDQVPDVP